MSKTTDPVRVDVNWGSLTAFQRDIIIILAGVTEPAGVDVQTELEGYYEAEINTSRTYQALTRLSDKGLVRVTAKDQRTNSYLLTDAGYRVLEDARRFATEMLGEQ